MIKKKSINIINFSPSDANGGASKAAYRIHKQIQKNDINSVLYVQNKLSDDESVINIKLGIYKKLELIYFKILNKFQKKKSVHFFSESRVGHVNFKDNLPTSDGFIVGLYWNGGNFISINELKKLFQRNIKVFWRLSDMWPFTGGCHYSYSCEKYINNCGDCPQQNFPSSKDISYKVFK